MPTGSAKAGLIYPQSAAAPLLVAPSALGSPASAGSVAAISIGSLSPSANALIAIGFGCRDSSATDVLTDATTPVTLTGISIVGSWEVVETSALNTADGDRYISSALLLAQAAPSPGTGTIQVNARGSCFSLLMGVWQITQGFALPISGYNSDTNEVEATSLPFTASPAASSLGLSFAVMQGEPAGSFSPPSGWSNSLSFAQSINITAKLGWKLLSPGSNPTWTGLDAADRTCGVYREVGQAA